jgi:integrase
MSGLEINPVSLVTVRGSSKRRKHPRSLTVEEFHALSKHLPEPFKMMARLQLCLGLRVPELLALRWQDVDWIGSRLNVEHGIVNQHLDAVKTEGSPLDALPPVQTSRLLQLRVLRLGFLQDGNVGVGVFPEGKKIFVSGERPNAGGIGIRSL